MGVCEKCGKSSSPRIQVTISDSLVEKRHKEYWCMKCYKARPVKVRA